MEEPVAFQFLDMKDSLQIFLPTLTYVLVYISLNFPRLPRMLTSLSPIFTFSPQPFPPSFYADSYFSFVLSHFSLQPLRALIIVTLSHFHPFDSACITHSLFTHIFSSSTFPSKSCLNQQGVDFINIRLHYGAHSTASQYCETKHLEICMR